MRLSAFTFLFGMNLLACSAHAQPPRAFHWFDGADRYQAFVDPHWVAVVQNPRAGDAEARQVVSVRLVEVTQPEQRAALARGEVPKGIEGTLSPVFTNTASGGRRMALPGNVIIWLDTAFDADQCRGWLAEQKLPVLRAVEGGRNAFVIAAPAGLPSLELANALRARTGVRAATPDWWKEAQTR